MNYDTLKQRHRDERDGYPANLSLRVHRSLSWLQRAEQLDDPDSRFIFLWIAFNAAYATEINEEYRTTEKTAFRGFLEKLVDLDAGKQLDELKEETTKGKAETSTAEDVTGWLREQVVNGSGKEAELEACIAAQEQDDR